jgi:glucosamine-6-phosphate deaminase
MSAPAPLRVLDRPGGRVEVYPDADAASRAGAERLARTIVAATAARGRAVLGLATGGTPVRLYQQLVARHKDGELSFKDVITYNLDEYYPIGPLDPNSYRLYMQRHLFDHVDLAPNRAHVLDGTVPEAFAGEHAAAFDRWIEADGGLDLQVLGIGRNGHIGFNEPTDLPVAEALALPTRVVALHPMTTADAAKDFGGDPGRVPRHALTLGVRPILAAREVLVLAFGARKAAPVAAALGGPVTAALPGSLLQTVAPKVTWLIDAPAAAELG